MQIVHVTPYFAPAFVYGGPPRSILGLCRALRRAGATVEVVTSTANGDGELPADVSAQKTFDDVPVTYVPRSFPKRYFRAAALAETLDRQAAGCDLVHLHGCWNAFGWAAARWCRRAGRPYVISPRGMLYPWSFRAGRVKKWASYQVMERPTLGRARFIHATSQHEADEIARLGLGVDVVVVPNGLEELGPSPSGERDAFRAKLGFRRDDFVILYLGRLHPKKGLDTLLDAMRRVGALHSDARLLMVGGGDPRYVASLTASARDLVEAGRVRFAGHLVGDDRRAAFGSVDAFALTSHSENFGLSVAEAIGAGLPVVVSRGCPWSQIETWRAGLWVDNTADAVATALTSLAADRPAAREMGERGRRAIREHLGWDRLAADMLQAYSRALR
ncbi:MAG: glycosyltransferase [Vicinamibacterales bacterium]